MKSSIRNSLDNISIVLGKKKLREIMFMLCFLSLFSGLNAKSCTYVDGFLSTMYFTYFLIIYFIILLYANLNVNSYFNSNLDYLIRSKTRYNHLKNILKSSFVVSTYLYILTLIFLNIFLCIFCVMKTPLLQVYNISTSLYLIYTIIKFYILEVIIVFFTQILLQIINKNIVVVLNIVFYLIAFYSSVFTDLLSSLKIGSFYIWIGNYFLSWYHFQDIFEDILYFIIFTIIMISIFSLFIKFVHKKLGDIG